jgi:hypothetical protein
VGQDGTAYSDDFGKTELKYFSLWGWTGQITPDLARRARVFWRDVIGAFDREEKL